MAKRFIGVLISVEQGRISRGSIKFPTMELVDEAGRKVSWKDMTMEREVVDALRMNTRCTFYYSKIWSTLYGIRVEGTEGLFSASSANPLMLVMSIGMIFLGLGTSMFLFPLLIDLAGIVGVFVCMDAGSAKSMFRGDLKAAQAASPVLTPS
jgi:hypothetical protein